MDRSSVLALAAVLSLCGCDLAAGDKQIQRSHRFDITRLSVTDGGGQAQPAETLQKSLTIPLTVKLDGTTLQGHSEAVERGRLLPGCGRNGSINLPWLSSNALVSGFAAIQLPGPSGKIFVCGGDESPNRIRFIADKTWLIGTESPFKVPGPTMNLPRRSPVLTIIPGGNILICGGFIHAGRPTLSTELEIYYPGSNRLESGGHMALARSQPTLVTLGNGRVLIIGGERVGESEGPAVVPVSMTGQTTAELYDPMTRISVPLGPVNVPENINWSAPLGDHEAILAGSGQMLPGAAPTGQTVLIDGSLPPPGNP